MAISAFQAGVNTVSAANINLNQDTLVDGSIIVWDFTTNAFVNDTFVNTLGNLPTAVSDLTNDLGFVTQTSLTQQLAGLSGGGISLVGYATETYVQNQINNINLFDGDYNNLTNKPTIPTAFSGDYNDLTNKPSLFSGDYDDLINKPTIFSGNYNDLVNRPIIPSLTGYATENYVNTQISNITDNDQQTLSLTGTDLAISGGNTIDLSNLEQTLSLSGATLTISGAGGNQVDLSSFSAVSSSNLGDLADVNVPSVNDGALLRYNATSGNWEAIQLDISQLGDVNSLLFSGNYNDLTNKPTIPNDLLDLNITDGTAGQVLKTNGLGSFFFANETGGGGGGGISLGDLSVTTAGASGAGSLTYSNGVFTFRPADLSGYATTGSIANLIGYNDISVTQVGASGTGALSYNNATGVFTYTPPVIPVDVSDLTDTTNLLGGGTSYTDSDVDSHLNTSTATNGQVLSWNGTDYVWTTNTGGGGAAEHIQWTTSGANNQLRISEQWLETGTTYSVRSVSINTDNLLEVELAQFTPTVSATGQSLSWDQPATQFSVSVDNPTDFTTRYINAVDGISSATGVHTTLADYTAGTKSLVPAGGVDWTQTFSTNGVAKIVSNGTGLSGGSAGATISFEDDQGATWTDTSNISFNWQNANASINFANLTGKNFLETYTTINYTVSITGLSNSSNATVVVAGTGGSLSNSSGSGTLTFTDALHKDNNTGRNVSINVDFARPEAVTGTAYTATDNDNDTTISANFTYPSFYIWQTDVSTVPTNSDIVDGNDFHADVYELGNMTKDINTTINNTDSNPRAFWFGVRTSATQPTTFQTGPSSSLLSDTNVTTGNTVSLEPTTAPSGYTAESYTLYGITLQPGQTYVRIT